MAEALLVGTVASCALTELIRVLIETTKSVRRCKTQCRELMRELEEIKPDVERVERRLGELRSLSNSSDRSDDIKMVEVWLERLKRAIELANIEVYRCSTSKLHVDRNLSGKIITRHNEISKSASNRVTLYLQLGQTLKDLTRKDSSIQHAVSIHGASSLSGSPSHGGRYDHYACPSFVVSPDSSLYNGSDSSGSDDFHLWGGGSVNSSSDGAALLRLMSQERTGFRAREDRTRYSLGHSHSYHHHYHEPGPYEPRRQTMDSFHGNSYLPHAQCHHLRPSYPS